MHFENSMVWISTVAAARSLWETRGRVAGRERFPSAAERRGGRVGAAFRSAAGSATRFPSAE